MVIFKCESFPMSPHSPLYWCGDGGCAKAGACGEGLGVWRPPWRNISTTTVSASLARKADVQSTYVSFNDIVSVDTCHCTILLF